MLDLSRWLQRVGQFYWSPEHPSTYVLYNGRGLGRLAGQDFGAFNLVWAAMPLQSEQDHAEAIEAFAMQSTRNSQEVAGAELGDWLTLLSPLEFKSWYEGYGDELVAESCQLIESALHALEILPRV